MFRVVVAPCSMKGSLSAAAVARIIAAAIRRRAPHIVVDEIPVADGGEGTVAALTHIAKIVKLESIDLLGNARPVDIAFLTEHHAVIECASVLGLPLVPENKRDPRRVSSAALAPLVEHAVSLGALRVSLAIGGTATVDGGLGLLVALGARVTTSDGSRVSPNGAGLLDDILSVDLKPLRTALGDVVIDGLVDVRSRLGGPEGALLYMAQKGAEAELALALERGLVRFVTAAGRDDVIDLEGAGAGGGLGAGVALMGGTLWSGADFVLDAVRMDRHLEGAILVVTGEGRFDGQTAEGKAIDALTARASRHGVPVVALVGERVPDIPPGAQPAMVISIARGPMSRETMMREAAKLVDECAFELAGMLPSAPPNVPVNAPPHTPPRGT
jgi:glycerate kinase